MELAGQIGGNNVHEIEAAVASFSQPRAGRKKTAHVQEKVGDIMGARTMLETKQVNLDGSWFDAPLGESQQCKHSLVAREPGGPWSTGSAGQRGTTPCHGLSPFLMGRTAKRARVVQLVRHSYSANHTSPF